MLPMPLPISDIVRVLTSHDIPAIPQVEFPSYHQRMNWVRTYYYGTQQHL
jgi:hypothetical protein